MLINALKNNQLSEAQKYLFIYEKVDPDNTEVYYLKAVYYSLQNNNTLAQKSLKTAVSKGFDDFKRIRNDSRFHFSDIEMLNLFERKFLVPNKYTIKDISK